MLKQSEATTAFELEISATVQVEAMHFQICEDGFEMPEMSFF